MKTKRNEFRYRIAESLNKKPPAYFQKKLMTSSVGSNYFKKSRQQTPGQDGGRGRESQEKKTEELNYAVSYTDSLQ